MRASQMNRELQRELRMKRDLRKSLLLGGGLFVYLSPDCTWLSDKRSPRKDIENEQENKRVGHETSPFREKILHYGLLQKLKEQGY